MGLFDNQTPDQQSALNQGLLGAGLGILANNYGPTAGWASIGRGGLQGLNAYNDALAQQSKTRVQDATTAHLRAQVDQMRAAGLAQAKLQQDMQTAWAATQAGTPPPQPQAPPPGMPGQPQSDLTPQAPQAPQAPGTSSAAADLSTGKLDFVSPQRAQAKAYANMADQLRIQGQFQAADKYTEMSQKLTPTIVSEKTVTDPKTGERKLVTLFSDNSHAAPPYQPEPEKLHWVDGGDKWIGVDAATGRTVITQPKSQSLESRASNAVAIRGQNQQMEIAKMGDTRQREIADMNDQRARDLNKQNPLSAPIDVSTPDGKKMFVQQEKATGKLIPVEGYAPPPSAAADTDLRDTRKVSFALDNLIKTYKAEYVGLKGSAGEAQDKYLSQLPGAAGVANPDRIAFRQNAAVVVNDYIKQITGATVGQTGEQQRLMRAVPDLHDSPTEFKTKMDQMRANLDKLPDIIANNPNLNGGKPPDAGKILRYNPKTGGFD